DRDGTLRLQMPAGETPGPGDVLVRRRLRTVDLRGRRHIEIRDIAVYGGMIDLSEGAGQNLISGVTSFHGNHTAGIADSHHSGSRSVFIQGDENTIERCEIAYGSGTGIWVEGRGNRILNNRIHDFNTLGNYDAPLALRRPGSHTLVKGNTIFHGGRDGVQFFHKHAEFAYNDVYRSNLIVHDCAPIYTVGGPFHGEIHHNWFHDVQGRNEKLYKAAGIYLDNSPVGFLVHHNVVWNTQWASLQMNLNADDIQIYNNTFWNGSEVNGWWRPKVGEFPDLKEDTRFGDVKQWNNLGYGDHWDPQTDQRNNLSLEGDPFVDFENRDFRPRPGSPAIDAGVVIEGINDDFVGEAPDVGAYEAGAEPWRAGIDWDPEAGPAGHGDYGLLPDGARL
ncbi:MAG: right-handed parallel beta-helix repeat-containing protein, partial [Verrucomicrobia bacterium]